MSIKITIYNDKLDLADEVQDEFRSKALPALGEAGDMWVADIHRRLSLIRGTRQTAAPEGQPPELDSGELLRSYKRISPRIVAGRIASSGIQSNHPGAARLEYGFTDYRGIRTFPHPVIRPSAAEMEGPIEQFLRERLG